MAYGGLLDILQGILGQQGAGQGYGQGQDQGNGLLAMMQQQQQGVPNQLATDETQGGTGILSGGYGTDRLLGSDIGTGAAPAAAGAGAATANAAPLAPAAGGQGGGFLSGLFGGGGGTSGAAAGMGAGLGQWVQKNPATIDALVTGFANIGNKNVGNPFLYGASQAAPEFKEQKARDELESRQEAMKSAMLKLGYPAELAAAAGKIPELGTSVISNALKPKDPIAALQEYQFAVSQGYKGTFLDYQTSLKQAGASNTKIDLGNPENAFSKKGAEIQAENFGEIAKGGAAARQGLSDVQTLQQLYANIGTGKGAEIKRAIGPWAQQFGINVENLSDIQAADAIAARLAPSLRVPGSGAQSDFELTQFLKTMGSVGADPQANAIATQTLTSVFQTKAKAADIANRVLSGSLSRDEGNRQIAALPDPMAQWREFQKNKPAAGSTGAPDLPVGGQTVIDGVTIKRTR
jgi:hypothetical protein